MTIGEIIQKIDTFTDAERKQYLPKILKGFSKFSSGTYVKFRNEYGIGDNYEAFIAAEHKVIKECLQMEVSDLGRTVREMQKIPIWTLETEI